MKTAAEFYRDLATYHPEHDAEDRAALEARDQENQVAALRMAAQAVDGMVVGGRAWNQGQQDAAKVLFDVSKGLREMADRIERGETPKP